MVQPHAPRPLRELLALIFDVVTNAQASSRAIVCAVGVLESTFTKHGRDVAALLDQREVPLGEAGAKAGGASVGKTLVSSGRGLDAAVSSIADRRDRAEK